MSDAKPKYKTVMLLDDNEVDNFVNKKMLENSNFAGQIYVHTSSKGALEFLNNLDTNGQASKDLIPDIIFVDINMPIMDGFQFLEEFEKVPDGVRSKSKVVMLTTSINPNDIQRCAENERIFKYFNKPLTQEHLDAM